MKNYDVISGYVERNCVFMSMRKNKATNYLQKNLGDLKRSFWWGALVGTVVFVVLYGVKILDVTYVDWIYARVAGGDVCAYQIGWEFFRNDSWQFPIGNISNMPTSTGGSILYMDAIPLFAVFFKIFRQILPAYFQYLGIWHLFCFAMQGGLACCILRKFLSKLSLCLCLTPLFLLTSFNLWRTFRHVALGGQWILLLAIFIWVYRNEIFYNYKRQLIAWTITTSLTIWIMTYFVIPVGFTMTGFLLREWMNKRNLKQMMLIFFSCVLGVGLSFWLLGGFINVSSSDISGFGVYSMNLLSLFDSEGYSSLIPDIPSSSGNIDGWQYLGVSGIFLFAAGLIILVYRAALTDDWVINLESGIKSLSPGGFVFLSLTVVALSPVVYLGSKVIIDYSWFRIYTKLMAPFRCSGRSFWICTYALLFFAATTVFRYIRKPSIACVLALLLVTVQFWDLSPLIAEMSERTRGDITYISPLASDFWEDVADEVDHVYRLSYSHWGYPEEFPLDFYASGHNLSINNAYVGRNNDDINIENVKQGINAIVNGTLNDNTLYCVEKEKTFTTECMTGENVVELQVDDYYVFIHKNIWDRLDQEKYRDIFMQDNGEYLVVRKSYDKSNINAQS